VVDPDRFAVSRRSGKAKRQTIRAFNGETARRALEGCGWGPGREAFGFNKGQFSLVDLIDAVLDFTGPAEGVISTWTAATADLRRVHLFIERRRLLSVKWIVDFSFENRAPEFAKLLREVFGDENIRTFRTHAKFALLSAGDWRVVLQTSMNLNQNPRIENFWLADDPELYAEFSSLVDEVFDFQGAGKGFGEAPGVRKAEFKRFGTAEGSNFYDLKSGADIF